MLKFFSKKEYRLIADYFGIGKIRKINFIRGGLQTPKAIVTTPKGKFVVSKHRIYTNRGIVGKSKQSLQYEIDLLKLLRNLPVPHFLPTKTGEFIFNFKGFGITVDRYIPGKQPKVINKKMAGALGRFLGLFHLQGKRFNKRLVGRRKFYNLNPSLIKKMHIYARRQKNMTLRNVVAEVKQGVENNQLSKNLPKGPIHVDIKPENELFLGDRLMGVVDFGNFYIDVLMIDIGKTIMWNCSKNGKLSLNLVKEFMRGYESVRKLSVEEKQYFKKAILFAIYSHIWVDLYHVPIKYVPESYTIFLVKEFLPVAKWLEKHKIKI
jgi:Ser/Thr protein kinase RdoA (MazF antagonist)